MRLLNLNHLQPTYLKITLKIWIFYQEQIANDINLTTEEKSYLINSIQSQIVMLPTILTVAELMFLDVDDELKSATLKKGWLKKTLNKV